MQYEITLPADYDMAVIRKRVATRGQMTDAFAGLKFKAYLVRERGTDGSPVNQYAPFYVWHDIAGMNRFLWGGGGFHGIVTDFGRPAVNHWTGVAVRRGLAAHPGGATRELVAIPAEAELVELVAGETAALESGLGDPALHTAALAIDPYRWQLVRFRLWDAIPAGAPGDRYQVLHLSEPA